LTPRGALGIDRAAPVGFRCIRLQFDLDSRASEQELDTLLAVTVRCCVVWQTRWNGLSYRPTESECRAGCALSHGAAEPLIGAEPLAADYAVAGDE
jgi:hypothetical protein